MLNEKQKVELYIWDKFVGLKWYVYGGATLWASNNTKSKCKSWLSWFDCKLCAMRCIERWKFPSRKQKNNNNFKAIAADNQIVYVVLTNRVYFTSVTKYEWIAYNKKQN